MRKKALFIVIPFLLLFLLGLYLRLRPQYQVPVLQVVETFTKQEKTGQRSSHRHTVAYAVVKVEFEGEEHNVTVHERMWDPLKAGDQVVVTQGLFGRLVEYTTRNANRLMLFSAVLGPVCILLFWAMTKRRTFVDQSGGKKPAS